MYDVIVIGGGIVGVSTAYHLVSKGMKTLLVDNKDIGQSTNAAAGIVSPETSHVGQSTNAAAGIVSPETSHVSKARYQFGVQAGKYYLDLVKQLENKKEGIELGYSKSTKIIVALDDDELIPFDIIKKQIFSYQNEFNYPDPNELFEISPEEVHELFPMINPVKYAIYYKNAAKVDGRLLTQVLLKKALKNGLITQEGQVTTIIRTHSKKITGINVNGNQILSQNVVLAGGAWSPLLTEKIGIIIPVTPQKGQIIHLKLDNVSNWPIIYNLHDYYLVPFSSNRIIAGATRENDSGYNAQPTVAGVKKILYELTRMIPSLNAAEIVETRVGLRPVSVDGLPILGTVPGVEGLILATGHGPTGLTLGPFTGKVISELISGTKLSFDISNFNISRFRNESYKENI